MKGSHFQMKHLISCLCLPVHQTLPPPPLSPSPSLQMKECGIPSSDSSPPAAGLLRCRWSAWGRGSATSSESSLLIAMVTDSRVHPLLPSLVNTDTRAQTHSHTHTHQKEISLMNKSRVIQLVWLEFEFLVGCKLKNCRKLQWLYCVCCHLEAESRNFGRATEDRRQLESMSFQFSMIDTTPNSDFFKSMNS